MKEVVPDGKKKSIFVFQDKGHEDFFWEHLSMCSCQDVYQQALIYCLGISRDTRNHIHDIYDMKTGSVKTECLRQGWQTGSSMKIVRMAFNLYCNGTPSVYDIEAVDEQLTECRRYTVEDLFCCSYARCFWQAIKMRYPEYCTV